MIFVEDVEGLADFLELGHCEAEITPGERRSERVRVRVGACKNIERHGNEHRNKPERVVVRNPDTWSVGCWWDEMPHLHLIDHDDQGRASDLG